MNVPNPYLPIDRQDIDDIDYDEEDEFDDLFFNN